MYSPNAFPDKLLLDGRRDSFMVEQLAAADLERRYSEYLPPSFGARQMVRDYQAFAEAEGLNAEDAYMNMRAVFTQTRGVSNRTFSNAIARFAKPAEYNINQTAFRSYLGADAEDASAGMVLNGEDGAGPEMSDATLKAIKGAARHIERFGWWKCRDLAPAPLVESLRRRVFGEIETAHGKNAQASLDGKENAPMQLRVPSSTMATVPEMYELAGDPLLLSIVQTYMGSPPIFNTPVAFLNSFVPPQNARALDTAAQLYHHDLHRLGFVKVFIYLTDVDEGSGPHTLVQKTHRKRPDALWEDGRHSDADIVELGIGDDEVRITGKAGTVFLVDTSCLHKGAHPETNSRIMAQIQYVNSLFGKPLPTGDRKIGLAAKSKNSQVQKHADLVREYASRCGVRFMQNYI